ncbi:MAG: methyltransferase family protein [Verrucomicrobiota bacterium]
MQFLWLAALAVGAPWGGSTAGSAAVGKVGLAGLLAVSAVFGLGGVARLGRNRTLFPRPRPGSRLVTTGVYRWVRHPLYLSVLAGSAAWVVHWNTPGGWGLWLAGAVFLDAKARREERWLREQFPGYAAYARRVRRLIPGVY